MEAFLLAVAAFLATADASNTAGQHPTAHALIYILSSPSTAGTVPSFYSNNGSLAGAGQVLLPEFGAFTEDNLEGELSNKEREIIVFKTNSVWGSGCGTRS